MKSVKLRGTLAFAVAIGFLMCTSCGYNFVQQDISIGSWANANNNPEYFHLGEFDVVFGQHPPEEHIDFRVKDNRVFLQSILDHPNLVRQEYNERRNNVYVFLNSGNHYLLEEYESKNKQGKYSLNPAFSIYYANNGTMYQYPLYDCSMRYDGTIHFHEGQNPVETKNDWQYFLNILSELPDECVTINESEKTALLSVVEVIDFVVGEKKIDNSKKIKIVYNSDMNGNYLTVSLIAN